MTSGQQDASPEMELMDMAVFQARYPEWLEENRSLLEAANWKEAFKKFPFVLNASAPWTPMGKPLAQSRLAVLTTAGLYVKGDQAPFDAANIEGDWTFRELPGEAFTDQLAIAHDHYPHDAAEKDLNAVYPLDRLNELVEEGVIGELAQHHYSISGYCTRIDLLVENSISQLVDSLKAQQVDAVLHIPV